MNTLSRAKTAQILGTSQTYFQIKHQWFLLINSARKRELAAAHHLLYSALMGKDWRKGFTPPTNRRKIENGAFAGWALFRAMWALHNPKFEAELLAPFAGIVTIKMLKQIRSLIPVQGIYYCKLEQFANGTFPFEAYTDREIVHA